MSATQYVALLRGINVGGDNVIKMADLRACLARCDGLSDVATYIQSGNVLFSADEADSAALAARLEAAVSAGFPPYQARILVLGHDAVQRIVRCAPPGFGADPTVRRSDVLYLFGALDASEALADVPIRPDVDEAHAGPGVLYFSRLAARASQSHLSRVVGMPIYQSMTIRNWNTTTRLLALMDARKAG